MKNIRHIVRHDLKKITSSAVAMIVIMGLCIVPCLYAWFNIFSNWDPYEKEATGRISVAVASEDEGADMLGFKVNVGETVIESLKANDDIGWVFVESKEDALEGVYSSDYYAALVIPTDFSESVLSFISGDPENPKMFYYENEKKNAIAPKITGKARTAVIEQVNATFVSTLAKYVSEVAKVADENGLSPQTIFNDLSDRLASVSDKLDNTVVMLEAVQGLTDSSKKIMDASDDFVVNIQDTIKSQQDLIDKTSDNLPKVTDRTDSISDAIKTESEEISEKLDQLQADLDSAYANLDKYNTFIEQDLEAKKTLVDDMQAKAARRANSLETLGLTGLAGNYSSLADKLSELSGKIETLESANVTTWEGMTTIHDDLTKTITEAKEFADTIGTDVSDKIDNTVDKVIADARQALAELNNALDGPYGRLDNLSNTLNSYEKALGNLSGGLGETLEIVLSMQRGMNTLSGLFDKIANSEAMNNVNGVLADNADLIAEYIKSPVRMDTEVVYPIREYGSAMAPFYTVLAQWIGSLLAAVLIKTKVKENEKIKNLKTHERFFGRFGIYLFVGIATALIVSLGNLLYVDIYCLHDFRFILAAVVNGIVFAMINYSLVFALDNIGLGAGVIILVLQVAGAGGTYPVEVLPSIFQKLYPFMPFKYAMNAMRECIGGMYENTYAYNIGMLFVFFFGAIIFGLLLYKPALWLNKLIAESKAKSDVML